ncbi:DNA-3-methyladenine glycosylase 2 family protein [Proteobacteria bacterium 005FR1]|nr:DNA-3-methyladenine glycosylase 2 family protein [Proteobacteria bacterium 005FR1]
MNASLDHAPLDHAQCYAAIRARDARFDGFFYVGVSSTGIYCRPVCRVRLPRPENCSFFPSAASAEQAGYRPCLRCRPELAPGSSNMDAVHRVAQQAAERIRAGALAEGNLEALAAEFQLSSRQLRRVVEAEFGVSPMALALTHRLHLGKQLLSDTDLKIIDVAFASGFSSLRRFNHAFRRHYQLKPSELRRGKPGGSPESFTLRLGYRPPFAWDALGSFLASRGNSRVERWENRRYLRAIKLGECSGWIAAEDDHSSSQLRVEVSFSLLPALTKLQARLRALFDLNASPVAIDSHLQRDELLATLVSARPGLRVPGTMDGFELCLRAILGQQVSVKAASTLYGRFVAAFGEAVATPFEGLDRSGPQAGAIASASLQEIIGLGLTERRATTIHRIASAVSQGVLDLSTGNRDDTLTQLLGFPGIGPWTAQYVAMRALGDPNALPSSDLGLMRALGVDKPRKVLERTTAWQPWRSYGAIHLWQHLTSGG